MIAALRAILCVNSDANGGENKSGKKREFHVV